VTAHHPWGDGSISIALYRHGEADQAVANLLKHARIAVATGYDGLTVAEHHAGFDGYFPHPTQVSEWILADTDISWAGPCPLLLTLRPVVLVLEELAWLAARHPQRVAAGLAAGYDVRDFTAYGVDFETRLKQFFAKLSQWGRILDGDSNSPVLGDSAIAKCLPEVPIVVGSGSPTALRAAGRQGLGIILPPLDEASRADRLAIYSASGGNGPRVLSRWVWLGSFPGGGNEPLDRLLRAYTGGQADGEPVYLPEYVVAPDADELAERLHRDILAATATCVSLRFFFPGLRVDDVGEQIEHFGRSVLPALRASMARGRSEVA
jgi:alkanesulfonate monooxygenase SsuD/methylene tetrahydromethanopterin reductase-like flavin-dependent oxidoreductase (luciferase family)